MTIASPLTFVLGIVCGWIAIAAAGLLRPRDVRFAGRVLFVIGALGGAALMVVAIAAIGGPTQEAVLPLGFPIFRSICASMRCPASFCCCSDWREPASRSSPPATSAAGEGTAPGLLCLQYHVFLASMADGHAGRRRLPVHGGVGDDGAQSRTSWSRSQHRMPEIRRAGFLYLLMAHLGALGDPAVFWRDAGWQLAIDFRCDARRLAVAGLGHGRVRAWPCWASAPRPAWCRCMSGCRRRIPPRPRRSRR